MRLPVVISPGELLLDESWENNSRILAILTITQITRSSQKCIPTSKSFKQSFPTRHLFNSIKSFRLNLLLNCNYDVSFFSIFVGPILFLTLFLYQLDTCLLKATCLGIT